MAFHSGSADLRGGRLSRMLISNSAINNTALDMNQKRITSVQNPEQAMDAANRWYVDYSLEKFQSTLQNSHGGYLVTLKGTEPSDIVNLRTGSYFLTINPLKDGYPTATFGVSKSSIYDEASITKISGLSGWYTPEQLEILWPRGSPLQLRKTGPGYDSDYLVDMNMKNTSDLPHPPTIPTDVCDMAYVDHAIREALNIRFGGQIVALHGTETAKVINLKCGSYMIAVSPVNLEGAPTACFNVSKNSVSEPASITRASADSGRSMYAEQLELLWPANSFLLLRKTSVNYDGQYLIDMSLKNLSTVPEILVPSDAATKAYVDTQIEARMQAKFSGKIVALNETAFSDVVNLQPGSYTINVSNLVPGGPTASFQISKNSPSAEASITRTSNVNGEDTGEQLDLIWPSNRMLALRKSGSFHDGAYLIDFNLKNISLSATEPTLPEDHATRNYVDQQIKAALNFRLEGVNIHLDNDLFVPVVPLKCGSYMIAVSALVHGGATASFALSKSSNGGTASITRITSCPALDTGEQIELIWPENSRIMLRKTGAMHSGEYRVELSLKNISPVSPDLERPLPTDIATRDFVHDEILQHMRAHYRGVDVFLVGQTPVPVCPLSPGSYVITITGEASGCPTMTVAVSKSTHDDEASITVISSHPGSQGGLLDVQWPPRGKFCLKKTNDGHNGSYLVNFNVSNLMNDSTDNRCVDRSFIVQLTGEVATPFPTPLHGSFTVHVAPVVDGPAASFVISKSNSQRAASTNALTSTPGDPNEDGFSATTLDLLWPIGETMCLAKSAANFDGAYEVKLV